MELLIVRHGHADNGQNPGLSTTGQEQAKMIATRLINYRIESVYSSPMRRAHETAQAFEKVSPFTASIVEGLAEIDKNASEYISPSLMKTKPELFEKFLKDPYGVCGISPEQFAADVDGAFEQITAAHEGETVVVFSHGIAINVFLSGIVGLPRTTFNFIPGNCSLSRVKISRSGRRSIVSFNESGHLLS